MDEQCGYYQGSLCVECSEESGYFRDLFNGQYVCEQCDEEHGDE